MNTDTISMLSLLLAIKGSSDDTVLIFSEKCNQILSHIPQDVAQAFYNLYSMRSLQDLQELERRAFQSTAQPPSTTQAHPDDATEYLSPSQRNLVGESNAFMKLKNSIENFSRSAITVLVNGITLDVVTSNDNTIRDAFRNAKSKNVLARQLLEIPDVDQRLLLSNINADNPFPLVSLKATLTTKSELDAQKTIRSCAVRMCATDTSGSGNESTFLLPQRMRSTEKSGVVVDNIYNLSARPDLTANFGHCYLDVKVGVPEGDLIATDLSVLCQAGERVYAERNAYGQIRRSVTFAATNKRAWAVIFLRNEDNAECIHFVCIRHDSLSFMWMQIWQKVQEQGLNYWLHADGTLLVAALGYLGLDYRNCFTKLISVSSSRVYSVCTPRNYRYLSENAKTTIGVSGSVVHFCLKVNRILNSFDRETAAHTAIAGSHLGGGVNFYATGALRNEILQAHKSIVIQKQHIVSLALKATRKAVRGTELFKSGQQECFWTDSTSTKRPELSICGLDESRKYDVYAGGVTFMLPGRKPVFDTNEKRVRWLSGVQRSLRLTHEAGYLHCDLRLTNILDFSDGVQVIDYDLATRATETTTVTFKRGGAQWDGAGGKIRSILDAAPASDAAVMVNYSAVDDHEMVERSMLNITTDKEASRGSERVTSGGASSGGSSRSATSADINVRGAFPTDPSSAVGVPMDSTYINTIISATRVEGAAITTTARRTMHDYLDTASTVAQDIRSEDTANKKRKF